jgi:Sulfite exporter TauE/SafE
MTLFGWICLVAVFFFTAVISVVTGGTSLITVPVMMQFGIEPHVAVATNMLALIFSSLGGTLPFLKSPSSQAPDSSASHLLNAPATGCQKIRLSRSAHWLSSCAGP